MERKFKIGDRIIFIDESHDGKKLKNQTGTIKNITENVHDKYLIEFDKNIDGHDGNGRTINGHGYYVPERKIKLLNSTNKIKELRKELIRRNA